MFSTEEEKRYVKMEEINLSPEISNYNRFYNRNIDAWADIYMYMVN